MRAFAAVVAPVVAAGAYLLLIPWDLRNRPATPGGFEETTPVTTGGVALLGLVLVGLAIWTSFLGYPAKLILILIVAPVSVLMLASYLTHQAPDANPWPLAWACLTLAMAAVVGSSALLTRRARKARRETR